ncbi:MAG: hypothetical protein ACOYW4_02295 [Bacillota bacterium]
MCCNSPVSALKQEAERLPEELRILEVLSVPWKAKKQHHYLSGHLPRYCEVVPAAHNTGLRQRLQ